MTYRPLKPWMALDDLLGLERKDRIRYVRNNLAGSGRSGRGGGLSLDEFAAAVGAKSRQRAIDWEKGGTPRDYAGQIASLTPYPPEAFGAPGEAELLRQMYGRRLRAAEAELEWLRRQMVRAAAILSLELEPLEDERPAQSDDARQ